MVAFTGNEAPDVEILRSPWEDAFSKLVSAPEQFLLLASPFITRPVTRWVGDHLFPAKSTAAQDLRIRLCR